MVDLAAMSFRHSKKEVESAEKYGMRGTEMATRSEEGAILAISGAGA
jgi:hypothetical protein